MNVWFHKPPCRPRSEGRSAGRRGPPGRPRQVLVTGFGPFPGVAENPSATIAARLADRPPPGLRIVSRILPTTWSVLPAVPGPVARAGAEIVLHVGVAAGTVRPRLEAVAWNRCAALADAEGRRPAGASLAAASPGRLRPQVAAGRIAMAVRRAGRAVDVSHSAGAYLCNAVFFRSLAAARRPRAPTVAFLHVPMPGPRRGGRLEDLADLAAAVVEALARRPVRPRALSRTPARVRGSGRSRASAPSAW